MLRISLVALLVIAVVGSAAAPAVSAPKARFGPGIDDHASYQGQDTCSPAPKPGVLGFQAVVYARHPRTGSYGISRACNVGGRSEHKEGRAWDWKVNRFVPSERAAARDVIHWLLGRDRFGHRHARARRFGIMYMIWNKRIWLPWSGWETYCVMNNGVCYRSGSPVSPHTNHIHFSFTWGSARKKTTWWRRNRSFAAGISASRSGGFWLAARNGSVLPYGSSFYGSKSGSSPKKGVSDVASTPAGGGYWLLGGGGRVWDFGAAVHRGNAGGSSGRAVAMAPAGVRRGYWVLTRRGRVRAFGEAAKLGGARKSGLEWAGIASTPTGRGYWLFSRKGKVAAFGDARFEGEASGSLSSPVVDGAAHGAAGYWMVTRAGTVLAFGDAPDRGEAKLGPGTGAVAGITPTPSGEGYWLATTKGKVFARGNAAALKPTAGAESPLRTRRAYPDIDMLLDD